MTRGPRHDRRPTAGSLLRRGPNSGDSRVGDKSGLGGFRGDGGERDQQQYHTDNILIKNRDRVILLGGTHSREVRNTVRTLAPSFEKVIGSTIGYPWYAYAERPMWRNGVYFSGDAVLAWDVAVNVGRIEGRRRTESY
ncbi:hypothetical protein GSI_04118 [Ganoderma sinense ZZ0214-1]|uniref:Uncharacterized protein n=1 Tax=Ganoderma sinense ZZ0214-1 TaxID=1077348 RepID=A0A2G8SI93_9APHY|nr:hypothetical protein GSI_04118 [Ganoderma sinense ZZ0214-1]